MKNQLLLMTLSGSTGGVIGFLFGGWSQLLTLFFFILILDYLSGVGGAIVSGKGLSSAEGMKGIIKKFAIVLIIILGNFVDQVAGTDFIMMGFIFFFMANELLSIVENYGKMGLPLPDKIKDIITILRDRNV
jgi:toxin secretion/phage lysis holin